MKNSIIQLKFNKTLLQSHKKALGSLKQTISTFGLIFKKMGADIIGAFKGNLCK